MRIIPTIEILDGRCVSLRNGQFDDAMVWHVDPIKIARGFAASGADIMRVTDFDAIRGGSVSDDLIADIIRKAGIPVQIAGGIRSEDRAAAWIDAGAAQVVVGSMAAVAPDMITKLAKYYPDQIVLSLDIWQGGLMTDGWRKKSPIRPEALIKAFDSAPLAGIVVTDIDSDAEDVDAQLGVISGLAKLARFPVIASGVVDTLDDLARLKYVPGISGAVVGRALMKKTFSLEDALEIVRPQSEDVAEFR